MKQFFFSISNHKLGVCNKRGKEQALQQQGELNLIERKRALCQLQRGRGRGGGGGGGRGERSKGWGARGDGSKGWYGKGGGMGGGGGA